MVTTHEESLTLLFLSFLPVSLLVVVLSDILLLFKPFHNDFYVFVSLLFLPPLLYIFTIPVFLLTHTSHRIVGYRKLGLHFNSHLNKHTHTHTHFNTHLHTHTHTHTQTQTHTHAHTQTKTHSTSSCFSY